MALETDWFYLAELSVSFTIWSKENGSCDIATYTQTIYLQLGKLCVLGFATCLAKAAEYPLPILIYLKKLLCVVRE